MPRTEVVKSLWKYFKDNELQDPKDRRFIICDDKLKAVFKMDRINGFSMNKTLSSHLKPKDEVTLASGGSSSTSSAIAREPAKKPSLSKELVHLLGFVADEEETGPLESLGRPQVVKYLWLYIKKYGLQERQTIFCDEQLKKVFKQSTMGIFEMNKLLSEHITYI